MKYIIHSILFVLIKKSTSFDYAKDTLEETYGEIIHASVIFRHGDRTPIATYPLDPYKNYNWSEGRGHLTKQGKKRLYHVGKWFQKRYNHLIRGGYSSDDFLMQSSDIDRALMSAQLFTSGFYPPNEDEMWHDNLKWQPIPIHSTPMDQDNIIALTKNCDAYNLELFNMNYHSNYQHILKSYEEFFKFVGTKTGIQFSDTYPIYNLIKLMEVYDALNVLHLHNMTLPEWSKSVFPEPIITLSFDTLKAVLMNEKMKRLKTGPFFKSLKTDMNNKLQNNFNQKLHFYSGHDVIISFLRHTLGIFDNTHPPYGAALIFELRKRGDKHYVTVLYENDTEHPPQLIQLPSCKTFCTLEDFYNLTAPFTTTDWDKECVVKIINKIWWPFHRVETLFLVFVVVFLSVTMFYFHFQRNKQKYLEYFCKTDKLNKE